MTHTTIARPVATVSAARPRLEPASPSQSDRPIDRLSWLWLACGLALLPFSTVNAQLPLAAWLAPIFVLRFARTQPGRLGIPAVILVSGAALAPASRHVLPPTPFGAVVCLIF